MLGQLRPCGTRRQARKERGEHVGVGGVQDSGDHVGAAREEVAVPLGVRRLEGDEERRVGHDRRVLLAVRIGYDLSRGLTSGSSDEGGLPGAAFLTRRLLQLRACWRLHIARADGHETTPERRVLNAPATRGSLQQFKRRGGGEQPLARLGPSRLRHARVERE
eukprot:scaffold117030_cov58-Phaeocystis_antarctica.AAC.2